jgi:hypothetical protein
MSSEFELAESVSLRADGRNISRALAVEEPDLPTNINGASMFWEARLKVYRARFHTHTASQIWEIFANLDNNMMRVQFNEEKGEYYLRTSPLGIPFDFRLAISDALRCLRSSLDYCVASMARKAGISDEHIQFPFNKERKQVENSFSLERKGKRQKPFFDLSRAYPELKDLILNRIQPFPESEGATALGDFLWRLITMDNIDKHRLLSPTIQFTHVKSAELPGGGRLENVSFVGWPANGPPPITIIGGTPNEPQREPDFTVDVVFPKGTRLAGKPVLSAFVEGANLVGEIIRLFEETFDGQVVSPS